MTHPNSVTVSLKLYFDSVLLFDTNIYFFLMYFQDVSVPEAYPVSDFDESAIKSGFAEANKKAASDNAVVRAEGQIELSVYTALARSLGVTL